MIWPALVFALAMIVFPFGYALVLSTENLVLGSDAKFIGLANYFHLFTDPKVSTPS